MMKSTISPFLLSVVIALIAATALRAPPAYAQETTVGNDSVPNTELADTAATIAKANAAAKEAAAAKKAAAADSNTPENKAFTKKAVAAGWRPEVLRGEKVYCRQQIELGSRFSKKVCGTQFQLAIILEQQEFERDQLKQRGCGGNCGGH